MVLFSILKILLQKEEVKKTSIRINRLKDKFNIFSPIITGVGTGCFDLEVSENV